MIMPNAQTVGQYTKLLIEDPKENAVAGLIFEIPGHWLPTLGSRVNKDARNILSIVSPEITKIV